MAELKTADERQDGPAADRTPDDDGARRATAEEALRRRRGRNRALLAVLGGLAVLFYLLTFVMLGKQ